MNWLPCFNHRKRPDLGVLLVGVLLVASCASPAGQSAGGPTSAAATPSALPPTVAVPTVAVPTAIVPAASATPAAPTVAASLTPSPTATATRPTATPAPVVTATPVPTPDIIGLDGTLVLYTALTAIRPNVDPNTYWDPHYGFKTWPPLAFVDPAVFDPIYGQRVNMSGDIQMFFFDRRAQASPDGRYILVPGLHSYPEYDVAGTGTWLLDLGAGEARQLLPDGVVATWSPASDAITYIDGGVLYTLSIAPGAAPQPLLADDKLWSIYAKWSPAGDVIAVLSVTPPAETVPYDPRYFADLMLVPVDGAPPRRLNTPEYFGVEYVSEQIAWSPDGQYLLAMNRVYDLAGTLVSPEYDGAVDWLPGGNRLLLSGRNGIDVITIAGEVLAHVDDRYSHTWALSHDGRRLAYVYGQWPDGRPGVAVYDLESDERWEVYAGGGSPIRWSADDSRIILGTYQVQNGERPQIITLSATPGGAEPQLLLDYAQLIEVVAWPSP